MVALIDDEVGACLHGSQAGFACKRRDRSKDDVAAPIVYWSFDYRAVKPGNRSNGCHVLLDEFLGVLEEEKGRSWISDPDAQDMESADQRLACSRGQDNDAILVSSMVVIDDIESCVLIGSGNRHAGHLLELLSESRSSIGVF